MSKNTPPSISPEDLERFRVAVERASKSAEQWLAELSLTMTVQLEKLAEGLEESRKKMAQDRAQESPEEQASRDAEDLEAWHAEWDNPDDAFYDDDPHLDDPSRDE